MIDRLRFVGIVVGSVVMASVPVRAQPLGRSGGSVSCLSDPRRPAACPIPPMPLGKDCASWVTWRARTSSSSIASRKGEPSVCLSARPTSSGSARSSSCLGVPLPIGEATSLRSSRVGPTRSIAANYPRTSVTQRKLQILHRGTGWRRRSPPRKMRKPAGSCPAVSAFRRCSAGRPNPPWTASSRVPGRPTCPSNNGRAMSWSSTRTRGRRSASPLGVHWSRARAR